MNNKITIYELLGLVKDGQAPKRIKFSEDTFIFVDGIYYEEHHINDDNGRLSDYYALDSMLNDEVEILDNEDEDIEEIDFKTAETQKEKNRIMKVKINELVKEINSMKKKIDYLKNKGE